MATFGSAETIVRRDLLNDNYDGSYRWSVLQVMRALNDSVIDVVRINPMAGYNQSTGARINDIHTSYIEETCECSVDDLALNEGNSEIISSLRDLDIPIDGRWLTAIAYIAAAKLLEIDSSDTENSQIAVTFLSRGREYALQ